MFCGVFLTKPAVLILTSMPLIILVQIRATRLAKSRHRGKSYFILVNNHHIQNGFLGEKISLPFDFLFLNEIGSVVSIYWLI